MLVRLIAKSPSICFNCLVLKTLSAMAAQRAHNEEILKVLDTLEVPEIRPGLTRSRNKPEIGT